MRRGEQGVMDREGGGREGEGGDRLGNKLGGGGGDGEAVGGRW